jgi:hypothetical protein
LYLVIEKKIFLFYCRDLMPFNISLPVKFTLPLFTDSLVGYLHCHIFMYYGKKILLVAGTQVITNNTTIPLILHLQSVENQNVEKEKRSKDLKKKPPPPPKPVIEYSLPPASSYFVPLNYSDANVTVIPVHGSSYEGFSYITDWEETNFFDVASTNNGGQLYVHSYQKVSNIDNKPPSSMTFSVSCRAISSDDFSSLCSTTAVANVTSFESQIKTKIATSKEKDLFGSNFMEGLSPIDKYDLDVYPSNDDQITKPHFFHVDTSKKRGFFFLKKNFFSIYFIVGKNVLELKKLRQFVISPSIYVFNLMPLQMAFKFLQIDRGVNMSTHPPRTFFNKDIPVKYSSPPYIIFPGRYLSFYHLPTYIPLEIQTCFPTFCAFPYNILSYTSNHQVSCKLCGCSISCEDLPAHLDGHNV